MQRSIAILMYHQIGMPPPRGTPSRSLTVSTRDFSAQMRFFKRLGYQGLSMRDLMPYLDGQKQGKVFGITFDDGFRNVYDNALPVLETLGFTSTNYIVSRQIGGSNLWDAHKGIPSAPCMNRDELLDWQARGQEIGAHTCNHPRLTELSEDAARLEIAGCRQEIESVCGQPVDAFCYPHGGVNATIRKLVEEAGYTNATTTHKANASAKDDRLLIPRLTVRRGDSGLKVFLKYLLN
ncbi:polysaccharide deacetylase family protein [Allorhizobium sp. BGMRC 0089]|uniref:polysaccharide deacetylase family protein n=1 Tax=Allorhizobium sonneratiae TaxID=2934936 RepID=UPI0020344B29|nr:polysaccharide deacetylase family protein [Allorhizobium sonneratiae]MCM2294303.1 polysaccharide deacetylase family protein [Allorhizobium sonneratiae]